MQNNNPIQFDTYKIPAINEVLLNSSKAFGQIVNQPGFNDRGGLNIALGMSEAGPVSIDLTTAPHALIAGQTGSGKSVCVNAIISSLLLTKTPDELRMIMIDPKVVELFPYNSIPHLLFPVLTETDGAIEALNWAVEEMENRFRTLAESRVRNIKTYNEKNPDSKMPYIVIVIDEFADLMYMARKAVEPLIIRLAQKARAIGIHLILATQRPSVDVITGILKANIPTRIAFKVASQIDARTIMDNAGAELLNGKGDMLLKCDGEPVRIQGCFLNDNQIEIIAGFVAGQFVDYDFVDLP